MKSTWYILGMAFLDLVAVVCGMLVCHWWLRNNARIGRAVLRLWDRAASWFCWAVRR